MRYLCLVNLDRDIAATISEVEWRQIDRDSLAYDDVLRAGGHYVSSSALATIDKAITVRIRAGARLTTDGPFVETKEFVAGFILIEAESHAQALDLAAGIPLARIGSVELRELATVEAG